jgi:hypothetical protein
LALETAQNLDAQKAASGLDGERAECDDFAP